MSVAKLQFIEFQIGQDELKEGLNWLQQWGKKTFKDYTGEWVEVRTSGQPNFFNDEIEAIPHVVENNC